MLNKILLSVSIVSLVIGTSFASVNNTITSKGYVDTEIDTKQLTIPVTGTNSSNTGNTVVTYTSTEGALGERELYTGANAYDAESDADKLITAAALNTAFTTLPTLDTNRLTCANAACNLWAITPQTAYGASSGGNSGTGNSSGSIMDILASLGDTNRLCAKTLYVTYNDPEDGGGIDLGNDGNCTPQQTNYGDWGAIFTYNNETVQVNGISACSTVSGTYAQVASNQAQVQSDYESNMAAAPTSHPTGGNCYCKLTDPNTSNARWVFLQEDTSYDCSQLCADNCSSNFSAPGEFREAVSGLD